MSGAAKAERLEIRMTRNQKKLLRRAAALEGRTLADFIVCSAQEAARRAIEQGEPIRLSTRDRTAFVAALMNPPVLTERLASALDRYRHLFAS
jgi:uncharacterized protein (DUF1778 family)